MNTQTELEFERALRRGCRRMLGGVAMLFVICALAIYALLAGGCSDLQAKPATARLIDIDTERMFQVADVADQAVALEWNATRFDFYHQTATVNWFAYAFGDKTIYCTPTIYGDLMQKAVLSDEYDRRMHAAAASTQPATAPAVNPSLWLLKESIWMQNIQRERFGK